MAQRKIKIVKLNYNIDLNIQRFTQYEGYLQLSLDKKHLIIMNKKPIDLSDKILSLDSVK